MTAQAFTQTMKDCLDFARRHGGLTRGYRNRWFATNSLAGFPEEFQRQVYFGTRTVNSLLAADALRIVEIGKVEAAA